MVPLLFEFQKTKPGTEAPGSDSAWKTRVNARMADVD
jgi:hypothetical protein